jgi:hypothetical protein
MGPGGDGDRNPRMDGAAGGADVCARLEVSPLSPGGAGPGTGDPAHRVGSVEWMGDGHGGDGSADGSRERADSDDSTGVVGAGEEGEVDDWSLGVSLDDLRQLGVVRDSEALGPGAGGRVPVRVLDVARMLRTTLL